MFLDAVVYDAITGGLFDSAVRLIKKRMTPGCSLEDYHEIYMLVKVTQYHYYCLVIHGVHESFKIDDVDSLPPVVRGQGRKHGRLKDFFVKNLSEKTLAKGTKKLFKAK